MVLQHGRICYIYFSLCHISINIYCNVTNNYQDLHAFWAIWIVYIECKPYIRYKILIEKQINCKNEHYWPVKNASKSLMI